MRSTDNVGREGTVCQRILSAIGVAIAVFCAASATAQPGPVTAEFENVPLGEALRVVQEQSGVRIEFEEDSVRDAAPVTAKVDGAAADEFLYEVLRPRGWEFIRTGERQVRLIPAASYLGATKQAGRALRTFARLERKLEGAEQHGDEVRVPGWTDADDRALARAIIDLAGAVAYGEISHVDRSTTVLSVEQTEAMLRSVDADVRTGTCIPLLWGWYFPADGEDAAGAAVMEALTELSRDEDPRVRASAVLSTLVNDRFRNRLAEDGLRQAILSAVEDPAPEVRFAAALLMEDRRLLEQFPELVGLAEDEHVAVRFLASLFQLESTRRRGAEEELPVVLRRLVAEPNPIARLLGTAVAALILRGHVQEALTAPLADPWMRVGMRAAVPLAQQDGPETALAASVALLRSEKRSHQAVGVVVTLAGTGFGLRGRSGTDLALPVGEMAESDWLWMRLMGVLMCSTGEAAEAAQVLGKALRSEDELERLAALVACQGFREKPVPPNLDEAILASLRRPVFAEQVLAAQTLAAVQPLDETLGLLEDELRRDPRSPCARRLLSAMGSHRRLRAGSREEQAAAMTKLIDTLLAPSDPELEARFVREMRHRLAGTDALVRLVERGRPETLRLLISHDYLGHRVAGDEVLPAVLQRIEKLFASDHPQERAAAAEAFAELLAGGRVHLYGRDNPKKAQVLPILSRMLKESFREDRKSVEAGFALLGWLRNIESSPFLEPEEMPAEMRAAVLRALELADGETFRKEAAELLAGLYRLDAARLDPEMAEAMDAARQQVMEQGTARDQVLVLAGLNGVHDPLTREQARSELMNRLMAGRVPDELRRTALRTLSQRPEPLAPEVAAYVLGRFADTTEDRQIRSYAGHMLRNAAQAARSRHQREGAPLPDWLPPAAEAAWKEAVAPESADRHGALSLYVAVAGQDEAAGRVEALVRDEARDVHTRLTATNLLPQAAPRTTLYRDLLKDYEKLPTELRRSLAGSAGQSREAPEAEAFVIRALKDEEIRDDYRMGICRSIRLPETEALRAALEELRQDPRVGGAVQGVLDRWDREARERAERQPTVGPTVAPVSVAGAASYERELKQLEDAAWKKQDTVQKQLTWYSLKPHGFAIADSNRKTVRRPAGVLGHERLVVRDVAFGDKKVWLGTDKGLIAWDRQIDFWALVGTGSPYIDAPVEALAAPDGKLRVTIHPPGEPRSTWECDPETMNWRETAGEEAAGQ